MWDRYQTLADTFAALGADTVSAEGQAWASLYEMVQRQALLLSFIDNFWWLAWIFAAVIPFVLFLGHRPRLGEPPAGVERHAAIVESSAARLTDPRGTAGRARGRTHRLPGGRRRRHT